MTDLLTTALAYANNGCTIVPLATDGSKMPAIAWKAYQDTPPDTVQLLAWFAKPTTDGLGLIAGAASGNLEMLEVEGRAAHLADRLATLMADHGLSDLWHRIDTGHRETTPSGGIHWLYRVTDGPANRNTKLARRPATPDELAAKPAERIKVLIETRGEGGFTVAAPSAGRSHPTGGAWTLTEGGPTTIPDVTTERTRQHLRRRRDARRDAHRGRHTPGPRRPRPHPRRHPPWRRLQRPSVLGRPPHPARVDARPPLRRHLLRVGTPRQDRPRHQRHHRPATTADRLYVFSSSTEFEPEKAYSKFGAYALLEHGGDHSAAARALRAAGYGSRPPAISGPAHDSLAGLLPTGTDAHREQPLATVHTLRPAPETRNAPDQGPTEDGTALALVDAHGPHIRYCPQRGSWLTWNGHKWVWDEAGAVREHVRQLARALPEDDGWKSYKKRALSATGVTGILRHAQTDPRVVVHVHDLDARPYELNTPAGIVDMRTGTLRPADPTALHTRTTGASPDFDTPSPLLEQFLTDTFGEDPAVAGYVQRLLGVAAIGAVLEQVLPFAHGTGANGKSTLIEAVMTALGRGPGGYAIAAPAEMLMVRKHSEHPAELAQLAGARLVVCSELEDGQKFAEARVKQLTGRDTINARFMRQNPFDFTPTHTFLLIGNHVPSVTTGGPAFRRRIKLIPFNHVVPEERRDPRLGERLAEQAPAILAWLIRGAADYAENGLQEPAAVAQATDVYAAEQDTVGRFLEDSCHIALGGDGVVATPVRDLRQAYESWCHDVGESPANTKRLTQELAQRGIESRKSNGVRRYVGVALLDDVAGMSRARRSGGRREAGSGGSRA